MGTIDLTILVLYMVFIVSVGLYKAGRVRESDDFLVAGRNLGFLVLTGTLVMTEFNTTTMISYSAFGYTAGLYATMLPLGLMVGMWVYGLVFSKRWKRINATSIADFFELRYGKRFRHVAAPWLVHWVSSGGDPVRQGPRAGCSAEHAAFLRG